LFRDGLALSLRLTIAGFVLAAPFFFALYLNVSTPPSVAAAVLLLAGLAAWPSVATMLLQVANRLHTRVVAAQAVEITGALTRLIVTGGLIVGGGLMFLSAVAATVISSWTQALLIR